MNGSNETICTIENELKNDAALQVEEIIEISPEIRKYDVTENNQESKWTNTKNIVAPSTVPKDAIIDFKELQPAKTRIENDVIYRFTNLLGKNDKQRKDGPMQEFHRQENQNTMWVQYSLGHGRGGFGAGSDDGIGYEPGDRNPFIILVFTIVTLMLSVTAIFLYCVRTNEFLREQFEAPSIFLLIFAIGGLILCQLCFMCVSAARAMPFSLILLIFTLITMSCVAALVTIRYSTTILFHAFIITAGVTLLCLVLACTSFDFTSFWLYVFGLSVAFGLAVMVLMLSSAITGQYYKTAHIILLFVGVLIQTAVLIMEFQAILGGKTVQLDESDYILGAYMLYTSIINIFLYIVQILGFLDD